MKQLIDTLNLSIEEALANLHTTTIAKVTGVNGKTINCQPVINRFVNDESIQLPEFIEVPPIVLQGGGSYLQFPIAVGDYCLLIITERCFDSWWNGQDFVKALEYRMHDYSDGVALVGLNNLAGSFDIPDVIQQTGDTNQDGNYTHQGTMHHTGNVTITGDLIVSGDLIVNGISFLSHVHGNVQSGSNTSGGPE